MTTEQSLLEIINSGEACSPDTLMPLFKDLEPASIDFMIGQWHGGKFDGGATPDPINWYGKRFVSRDYAEPLLCRRDDGSIYAWENWGAAQLRDVAFGGKVQACLIYDEKPMMDYFRKVTDDIVLGLGDIKGQPTQFFFWLRRDQ